VILLTKSETSSEFGDAFTLELAAAATAVVAANVGGAEYAGVA